MSAKLSVPEVARQLSMDGADVYELIFAGELEGGPDSDGAVFVTEAALADYERRRQQARSS
jgi:hypothetical protein